MIAHTSIYVSDYQKSKQFYREVLGTIGYKQNMEFGKSGGFNDGENTDFWIGQKNNPSPHHVAFTASSRRDVDDFYDAAIKAGATDNGRPGLRPENGDNYYAAFVHDFDGNNIEVVCFSEE